MAKTEVDFVVEYDGNPVDEIERYEGPVTGILVLLRRVCPALPKGKLFVLRGRGSGGAALANNADVTTYIGACPSPVVEIVVDTGHTIHFSFAARSDRTFSVEDVQFGTLVSKLKEMVCAKLELRQSEALSMELLISPSVAQAIDAQQRETWLRKLFAPVVEEGKPLRLKSDAMLDETFFQFFNGRQIDRKLIIHTETPASSSTESSASRARQRFELLLRDSGIEPAPEVMLEVVRFFAPQLEFARTPQEARYFYDAARSLPRSSTKAAFKANCDLLLDRPFQTGGIPSRSTLLTGFRRSTGSPLVVKLPLDPKDARREADVWKILAPGSLEAFLVPSELVEFGDGLSVDDIPGNATHHRISCALLMPMFSCTLHHFPAPLDPPILNKFSECLSKALSHLHLRGFCHLDVKPTNVFIDSRGFCFLGDFGASVEIGAEVRECSRNYFPKDAEYVAKPQTDWLLLAVTLLEKLSLLKPAEEGALSIADITQWVSSISDTVVRGIIGKMLARAI